MDVSYVNNVGIVLGGILALFGGITVIAGGATAVMKLFNPFKTLKKQVCEHDQKLIDNDRRIDGIEKSINCVEESNRVICKSLLVLLNHEVTGNGVDKIKVQRDALEQFLISK